MVFQYAVVRSGTPRLNRDWVAHYRVSFMTHYIGLLHPLSLACMALLCVHGPQAIISAEGRNFGRYS